MSREIDTSGGTATKDDVLHLAAREEIPAVKAQREEVLADMNQEELRKVLAGEISVDDWDPSTAPEEPDEGDEGDDEDEQ
jgi:hypothetical protein